ncbi:MAG: NAD(P)-dependent oxidoreductase [Thermoplasmata archaeon]
MPDPLPRLLVTVRRREDVGAEISRAIPGLPWDYLAATPSDRRRNVEALLVGAFERELADLDPAALPRLEFVQRIYTGVDGFPFERFPPPIRVAGNVGAYAPFVSEHAVLLALAAGHDLSTARAMVAEGQLRPPPEPRLLYGSTAVILGYGEIGRDIARRLAPFETHLVGVNRTGSPAPECERMFAADQLGEALPLGDFVFDVRPLTDRTAGTIGPAEFAAMRPGAVYVNVGRAGTVDEEALYRHLESHPTFRAAIDVWWDEDFESGKIRSRFPFARLPNFVGTPHSAGVGSGSPSRVLRLAVENLARFFQNGRPLHVVDPAEYRR